MDEIIKITSEHVVILSEDNKNADSVDAKFIICDFSPSGNNVSLNRDTIDNWSSTLNTKPVVGKVITSYNGKEDFSGHNVKVVKEKDENGNEYKTVEFDTQAFGAFHSVSIETIDDVEYIVATAKIWKRFKKAFKVFKARVESKKGLKTSWEVSVAESHDETIKGKNVKVIDLGTFIGHCALGANVKPAYKSSGVIDVASENEQDDEFLQAFSEDILALSETENPVEGEDDVNIVSNQENISEGGNESTMENENKNKNVVSAVTDNDLYSKVRKAVNSADENKYYYVAMLYPYEYSAYGYTWDRASEEDFVKFTYSVNSDETISIISQKEVKMTFVDKSTLDSQISELEDKVTSAESEVAEAGKSLTELTKEKEAFETQISELGKYKEKVEELEAAEQERELSEKKEDLKTFTLEDDLIESSELESDETISVIFSELTLDNFEISQGKIEVIKGRRAIQKYKETKSSSAETVTSEVVKESKTKTDLNSEDSDAVLTAMDIMKSVLSKQKK